MATIKRWLTVLAVIGSLLAAVASTRFEANATSQGLAAGPVVASLASLDPEPVASKTIDEPPSAFGAKFSPDVVETLAAVARTTTTTTARPPTTAPPTTTPPPTAPPTPPPTTGAPTTAAPTTAPPLTIEERGQAALTSISYPWQERLPEWEIRFHGGRSGAYGYTIVDESVIDIYIRDGQTDELLRHVIAHEIGHAVDVTLNDGDERRRWQEARSIEDHPWWPNSKASDFATGAGDFAEAFAAWQVGLDSYRSQLAPPPDGAQLALLSELAGG